jgi:hypothetical protein
MRNFSISDKCSRWQSRRNRKSEGDRLHVARLNGLAGSKTSTFRLTSSAECVRVLNLVGNVTQELGQTSTRSRGPATSAVRLARNPPLPAPLSLDHRVTVRHDTRPRWWETRRAPRAHSTLIYLLQCCVFDISLTQELQFGRKIGLGPWLVSGKKFRRIPK